MKPQSLVADGMWLQYDHIWFTKESWKAVFLYEITYLYLIILVFFFLKHYADQTERVCMLGFRQSLHFHCFYKKHLCNTLHWDLIFTFDISTCKLFNLEQVVWLPLLVFIHKVHLTLNKSVFLFWTSICHLKRLGQPILNCLSLKNYGCGTVLHIQADLISLHLALSHSANNFFFYF